MKNTVRIFLAVVFACSLARAGAITLDAVMARTLQKNPRILQAKAGLEGAAGQRLILRSVALPQGLIGAIAGDQGGYRAGSTADRPFAFAYGSFLQPLFHAGIPASFRRGDIARLIARQQLNVSIVEELHRTRVAFYTALLNQELESLGRAQRERLEKNITGEQARYDAGQGERGAVTSATLLTQELDPQIELARRAFAGARVQLAASMGDSLGAAATLPLPEGKLAFQPVRFHWQNEIDAALQRRTDLKLARLFVRAAREDQRIAAGDYYPTLDAVASGEAIPVSGVHRDSGGSPQASDDTVASEVRGGAAYTWRVIDNGQVGGAVSRLRGARETNEVQLQKLEANMPRELARLQNNLEAIEARYRSFAQTESLAEKNIASIEENRGQGLSSAIDFRTAENSLLETQRGLLTVIYQEQIALAEWDRATGRYFQFSDEAEKKVQ